MLLSWCSKCHDAAINHLVAPACAYCAYTMPLPLRAAIVRQMYAWGFVYVENLTWVMMRPNNTILRLPHTYTSKSHVTLMIFRREGV